MFSSFSTFQSILDFHGGSTAPPFSLNNTSGLLRYNMDNNGTNVFDSFPSSRNGSIVSTSIFSSNIPTNFSSIATLSWTLNNSNGRYILAPSISIANKNITTSCWIFCTSSVSGGDIKWWEIDHAEGPMLFQNKNTNNYSYCYLITWSMSQNVWNHVVCIDNFTNLQKSVYVNGSLVNTISFASYQSFYIASATTCNGARVGAGYSAHRAGIGQITDFRIYNRILTPTEITSIYNKQS
jgi:hypothetical protein